MMSKFRALAVALAALSAVPAQGRASGLIHIVAAENVYGDVAQQIGGADVRVTSVLGNPDQDPHLFEASPSVAREVAAARIVVCNGADYDPWMGRLLEATRNPGRQVIVVAELAGRKPGDNPHVWYDPGTVLAYAEALTGDLSSADPAREAGYRQHLARFRQSLQPVRARTAALRERLAGTPVTATEPVLGYMLDALGLEVRNRAFQLAVMNNTEPGASDVAAFENDLRTRRVRMLVYNSQASDPVAARMQKLALASHIPVVGASETEPAGRTYQEWMRGEIEAIDRALAQ